jgi:C4-dicarboxylate-specific signal transduction histidine kinase
MRVSTDEHYLKTVMRNLTNNAVKALGGTPQASIAWKAWEENGKAFLSVTDNGPGATDQQLKALYDDSAPIGIKSGLGLHVVRDMAHAIACEISVQSAPGRGTQFTLSL